MYIRVYICYMFSLTLSFSRSLSLSYTHIHRRHTLRYSFLGSVGSKKKILFIYFSFINLFINTGDILSGRLFYRSRIHTRACARAHTHTHTHTLARSLTRAYTQATYSPVRSPQTGSPVKKLSDLRSDAFSEVRSSFDNDDLSLSSL